MVGSIRHLWRWRWVYLVLGMAGGLAFKWVWQDPQQRLVEPLGRGWRRIWNGSGVPPTLPPPSSPVVAPPQPTAVAPRPSPPHPTTPSALRAHALRGLLSWYAKNGAWHP